MAAASSSSADEVDELFSRFMSEVRAIYSVILHFNNYCFLSDFFGTCVRSVIAYVMRLLKFSKSLLKLIWNQLSWSLHAFLWKINHMYKLSFFLESGTWNCECFFCFKSAACLCKTAFSVFSLQRNLCYRE